jgi:hypothetical protein
MKATKARLVLCLRKSPHCAIPIYRGVFSWALRRFRNRRGGDLCTKFNRAIAVHLAGSILGIKQGLFRGASQ